MPLATPHGPVDNYCLSTWLRQQRLKARRLGVHVDCGYEQMLDVLDDEGWDCFCCGQPAQHAVFLLPPRRGGPLVPANLAPACPGCAHRVCFKRLAVQDLVRLGLMGRNRAQRLLRRAVARPGGEYWISRISGQRSARTP